MSPLSNILTSVCRDTPSVRGLFRREFLFRGADRHALPSESIWPSVEPHREVASAAPMSSVLPAWLDTLRT